MKSEPEVYSIADLEKDKRTYWDGVRNYQARNLMRDEMRIGDKILFYHSNANPPGVAGIARIVKESYPDHTALDPEDPHYDPKSKKGQARWYMVDIEFEKQFDRILSLAELRETQGLENMILFRRSRLSVQPVEPTEFRIIVRLGKAGP